MGIKTIEFSAALHVEDKFGKRLDKKTGRIPGDIKFERGKLSAPVQKDVCHCFFNDKAFLAIAYNRQVSSGIGIVPGVAIPLTKKMEMGQAYVGFEISEIMDYKRMKSMLDGKRLVLNTNNFFIHIRAVTDKVFDQPFRNRKLISKIHEEYEKLGIRSAGGMGYMAKYDDPFLDWLQRGFNYFVQKGYLVRRSDFKHMICPTHQTTGRFIFKDNAFFCDECNSYLL